MYKKILQDMSQSFIIFGNTDLRDESTFAPDTNLVYSFNTVNQYDVHASNIYSKDTGEFSIMSSGPYLLTASARSFDAYGTFGLAICVNDIIVAQTKRASPIQGRVSVVASTTLGVGDVVTVRNIGKTYLSVNGYSPWRPFSFTATTLDPEAWVDPLEYSGIDGDLTVHEPNQTLRYLQQHTPGSLAGATFDANNGSLTVTDASGSGLYLVVCGARLAKTVPSASLEVRLNDVAVVKTQMQGVRNKTDFQTAGFIELDVNDVMTVSASRKTTIPSTDHRLSVSKIPSGASVQVSGSIDPSGYTWKQALCYAHQYDASEIATYASGVLSVPASGIYIIHANADSVAPLTRNAHLQLSVKNSQRVIAENTVVLKANTGGSIDVLAVGYFRPTDSISIVNDSPDASLVPNTLTCVFLSTFPDQSLEYLI